MALIHPKRMLHFISFFMVTCLLIISQRKKPRLSDGKRAEIWTRWGPEKASAGTGSEITRENSRPVHFPIFPEEIIHKIILYIKNTHLILEKN